MDTLFYYFLKSGIWLFSFATVYFVFLRNERYFELNRYFLLMGIVSAFVFPLITFNYEVISADRNLNLNIFSKEILSSSTSTGNSICSIQNILLIAYISGVILFFIKAVWQIAGVLMLISNANSNKYQSYRLIQTTTVKSSFSFFVCILIHPSINKVEKQEIINHELGHIKQKHWVDLLLFEILRISQWFNPVVWIYGHMMKQNHEYLADKYALQNSTNSVVYKATLINQIMGGSVIALTNSFTYSSNQKRFHMMNVKNQCPERKFKLAYILPFIACVFYAFSEPDYVQDKSGDNNRRNSIENNTIDTVALITVGHIFWENNKVFSADKLTKTLGVKTGDVLSEKDLKDRLSGKVTWLYGDQGYLWVNFSVKQSVNKNGKTDFVFDVSEDSKCFVGGVSFNGKADKTNDELKNLVKVKEGDVLTRIKLVESIRVLGDYLHNDSIVVPDLSPKENNKNIIDVIFNF